MTSSPFFSAVELKVADEVWIISALLHREQPDRVDFSLKEIENRARRENITGELRKGLYPHASLHCVANLPPNPAIHRMLYATGKSRRRLFREGDDFHPGRAKGKTHPQADQIPRRYHHLLDWYRQNVAAPESGDDPLLALSGSGTEIWQGEPADAYVRRLRDTW